METYYGVPAALKTEMTALAAAHGSATWIRFDELTPNPATKRWAVMPKDGPDRIGIISWYGPWRKYCFFPTPETVYEQVCLREIADFCEVQTAMHRLRRETDRAKSPNEKLTP